jgi:hypothetical protein
MVFLSIFFEVEAYPGAGGNADFPFDDRSPHMGVAPNGRVRKQNRSFNHGMGFYPHGMRKHRVLNASA